MSKDPAFLFYSQDFLTGVADLTFDERGQYITMLCIQHQKGSISSKWLSINLSNVSKDVLDKFEINESGDYYSERLAQEMGKRESHLSYKIASACLGGLISANKVSKKDAKKIRDKFNIIDYKDLSKEEAKKEVSKWFKQMLNLLEDDNIDNNINIIDYKKLIKYFNDVTGKSSKVVCDKTKGHITARLKEGYTKDDIAKAIQNCYDDDYHIKTEHKYLTLEFITRADKLEKYSTIKNPYSEKTLGQKLLG